MAYSSIHCHFRDAFFAAAAAVLIVGGASAAGDDDPMIGTTGGPDVPFRGCIYYEHINFTGASVEIREGTNRRYVGDAWNDRISSAACHSYCNMTVYEHRDFGGAKETIGGAIEYMGGFWNDRVSSMNVACEAPPAPRREEIDAGMEDNTNRVGSDYHRIELSGRMPEVCQKACKNDPKTCRSWTYVRPGVQGSKAVCYLKTAIPDPTGDACCISGVEHRVMKLGKQPAGAAPPRCKPGFVWREAKPDDYVCVTPESRERARQENASAAARRDPDGAYGPNTCISGYVWREALVGDTVCVTPEVRMLVQEENRLGPSRTDN